MALPFEHLQACIDNIVSAGSGEKSTIGLSQVLGTTSSRAELGRSFSCHGSQDLASISHDYLAIFAEFQRLLGKHDGNPQWREVGKEMRTSVLHLMPEPQRRSAEIDIDEAPPGNLSDSSSEAAEFPDAMVHCCTQTDLSTSRGATTYQMQDAESSCWSPRSPGSAATCEPVDMVVDEADGHSEAPCWVLVMLAALLPLLADALPRDQGGVCIIPHPHEMKKQEALEGTLSLTGITGGRPIFRTNKICDNCGSRITDRYYFHCSFNCDIDFCQECHQHSQNLLSAFLQHSGDADAEEMRGRLFWVIDIIERTGFYVLSLDVEGRNRLAHELAFEWPAQMFEQLTQAVIDVVNAKVVHVQDVKDIESDERFWYAVGLLQFLYSANALPCSTRRLDEAEARGPKVEYERFILEGINKCEPLSEFQRWRQHPAARVPNVLQVEEFRLSADFCSFLTHSNLVPVSFRRVCLLCDVWEQIETLQTGRIQTLHIEVPRDPRQLVEKVLETFAGLEDRELRRPLRVTFSGEEAIGPGVTREFFQVALRSFLEGSSEAGDAPLFRCHDRRRTYWFNHEIERADAFRAVGVLLGQAVLNNVLVPNVFPRVLFERLLQDLDSSCAKRLTLEDLAAVSEEISRSLQHVLEYQHEDIGDIFGDLEWPRGTFLAEEDVLCQANKGHFVQAYVESFFRDRVALQFGALSAGFRIILGGSCLLRTIVDAVQLEKIVCGGTVPIDVPAIRRGSQMQGWTEEELSEYVPKFWKVLDSFSETEKVQFVVFVTASNRVPLRGWQDLGLIVQKNGVGDDRLPAAYTCFSQLLLPKYSDEEQLRRSLLLAVANSEGFGLR